MTIEQVKSYSKEDLVDISEKLGKEDIRQLVEWLDEKDDKLRYPSFLMLQYRSQESDDVYPHWDVFANKLASDNSFQRSIGLMLIAENVKWDKKKKITNIIDTFLTFCNDEKVITSRQCIQSLDKILKYTNYDKDICDAIVKELTTIDILKRPNTNWKVMTTDIVNVLISIQKEIYYKEIAIYLKRAFEGTIIDKKLKNEIKELLN